MLLNTIHRKMAIIKEGESNTSSVITGDKHEGEFSMESKQSAAGLPCGKTPAPWIPMRIIALPLSDPSCGFYLWYKPPLAYEKNLCKSLSRETNGGGVNNDLEFSR